MKINKNWSDIKFYNLNYTELNNIFIKLLNNNFNTMYFCILIKINLNDKIYERSLTKVYIIK